LLVESLDFTLNLDGVVSDLPLAAVTAETAFLPSRLAFCEMPSIVCCAVTELEAMALRSLLADSITLCFAAPIAVVRSDHL